MFKRILPLLFVASMASAQNFTINTIAGNGAVAPGQSATSYGFDGPQSVAVDSSGNLYVAMSNWCQVWVVNASGTVTQVIGSGTCGFSGDNGPAVSAQLGSGVQGVAVDNSGNIYIADNSNNRVRRVSGGIITTVAGGGVPGCDPSDYTCVVDIGDGHSATSAIVSASGIAVDNFGDLYIASGHRVRVVSGGIIGTVAGNGELGYNGDNISATSATLDGATGVAMDNLGNLYIAETGNARIRKVSGGIITTVAGGGSDAHGEGISATSAALNLPVGVALDAYGNLYIADSNNQRIRKVSGGIITTVAGNGAAGYNGDNISATSAELSFQHSLNGNAIGQAIGVAVDKAGNLYIADGGNNRVRKVTSGVITTVVGNGLAYGADGALATNAQLNLPGGTAVDSSGNLFIADSNDCVVRKVAAGTGTISTVAGIGGVCGYNGDSISASTAKLNGPVGVAVDYAGNLYIAETWNGRIRKVSDGIITTVAGHDGPGYNGDGGSATSATVYPLGVAVDSSGNLYIADGGGVYPRVRKVSGGIITTVAGNGIRGYSGDGGSATSAQLRSVSSVAVDSAGNLYFTDDGVSVRKVAGGIITTIVAAGYVPPGVHPNSVAVDKFGNLYVADSYHNRIYKVSGDGAIITTVAGNGTAGYSGDGGSATSAELNSPSFVAVDNAGNVYVSDAGNNRVRVLTSVVAPSVVIDTPAANATLAGTATISGWAIDNTSGVGSAISVVQVKVDGLVVGNASYGISRPDVCAAFPGRPGCPGVGYTYLLDTSLLAPGTHTITVSATDTDSAADTGSASVTVTVIGAPSVRIDSPLSGSVLSSVATVSGWAIDNTSGVGTAIASVQVKVDGNFVGNASYGTSRPDVCAAFPGRPGCPNVGFTYSLNTATLAAGSHVVTVSATDSDGIPDIGSSSVTITVPGSLPSVYAETPTSGAVLSGIATVSGWAIDSTTSVGTPIASVQVKVDGAVVGNATYGLPRPDVCGVYPGRPGCPNVGFTYALDTTRLTTGAHTLSVIATDMDGTPDTGTWTVSFQVASPPAVVVDSPAPGATVAGTITVSGWALDNTSAIGSVQVRVDGTVVGNATYGLPRVDVCAVYPGRPGCPNVGFTYSLDTTKLMTGAHTVTVLATDTDVTPDSGSFSVTVNVTSGQTPPRP